MKLIVVYARGTCRRLEHMIRLYCLTSVRRSLAENIFHCSSAVLQRESKTETMLNFLYFNETCRISVIFGTDKNHVTFTS